MVRRVLPVVLLVLISVAIVCSCSEGMTTEASSSSNSVPQSSEDGPVRPVRDSGDVRSRTVRFSGLLESARSTRVVAPQLIGPFHPMTLVRIVENGSRVEAGDIVAEFSAVEQLDDARAAAARYEDLRFQVRQREADNAASAESRRSALEQARADLEKALLEVSKAEILSEIEASQNQIRAEKAQAEVDHLLEIQPEQERAERAALRILELQRNRALGEFQRAEENLEKLRVRAPISGMVWLSTRYSNGNPVRPQQGDQMNRNNPLMSIFDPSEMIVRVSVAEPDGALLDPGLEAQVLVDAYPEMKLPASFVSASPVAARSLTTPVKTFTAIFRLDESDPRLMPDLSAAVVFDVDARPDVEPGQVDASEGNGR